MSENMLRRSRKYSARFSRTRKSICAARFGLRTSELGGSICMLALVRRPNALPAPHGAIRPWVEGWQQVELPTLPHDPGGIHVQFSPDEALAGFRLAAADDTGSGVRARN